MEHCGFNIPSIVFINFKKSAPAGFIVAIRCARVITDTAGEADFYTAKFTAKIIFVSVTASDCFNVTAL